MARFHQLNTALALQRGHLFCWVPVCLALGIGGYFALSGEPEIRVYAGLIALVAGLLVLGWWSGENLHPLLVMATLVALGALLAGARAHQVGEPVLGYRYYGPIQGRIIKVDRSASDAVRLTLDRVVLKNMAPAKTPTRVRVSLHGQQGYIEPEPGLTIILTGHLSPPSGPVEPGGFDFQRMAWFDRLGAVGYTRTPVLAFAAAQKGGAGLRLFRLRMNRSHWVQANMPGEAGAFAAAVMTGDRSAMGRGAVDDLRASNLAHLLAISGLHIGLLCGFVFTVLRYILAAWPRLALRIAVKKVAAVGALVAGAGYLALSGGNVATERAFVMVAVMFLAVLMDRRALTLRAVAVAAIIVLVLRPEVLPEPGFQMSFAATTALVAVFGVLRNWRGVQVPKVLRPVLAVVISSAVAGLATAPIAAAHFNRIADYGLVANLLSVPLMGLVVMPGAVLAAILAPFGLGWVGLAIMEPAIRWILGVAHWIAGLDGALSYVPAPGAAVLPMLTLGVLWMILWQGSVRARTHAGAGSGGGVSAVGGGRAPGVADIRQRWAGGDTDSGWPGAAQGTRRRFRGPDLAGKRRRRGGAGSGVRARRVYRDQGKPRFSDRRCVVHPSVGARRVGASARQLRQGGVCDCVSQARARPARPAVPNHRSRPAARAWLDCRFRPRRRAENSGRAPGRRTAAVEFASGSGTVQWCIFRRTAAKTIRQAICLEYLGTNFRRKFTAKTWFPARQKIPLRH